jgi:hypothetical protein
VAVVTRWYRAYAGTVKDDKLAEAAIVAGCSRSVAIAVWHALLESAAETDDGGRFETTARRVAAILGEPAAAIEAVFAAMAEIAMIDGDAIAAWKRRQFESDSSTERSRKHREAKRNAAAPHANGDATLHGRSATPPDTETESEKITPETKSSTANVRSVGKPTRPAAAGDFEEFWKAYPHRGEASDPKKPAKEKFDRAVKRGADPVAIIAGAKRFAEIERRAGRAGTEKCAQAMTWLNQERWNDYAAVAITERPEQIFVKRDTEEWFARVKAGHKPGLCKFYPEQQADGWYFAAQVHH